MFATANSLACSRQLAVTAAIFRKASIHGCPIQLHGTSKSPLCWVKPTFLIEGFDMNFSKRKTCMAIGLAVSALGSAFPTTAATLVGGGSSLVGPLINAEIALFGADPDSLTYYITSSGTGQTAFLSDNAFVLSSAASGTVYFANSDAPLSVRQMASYNSVDKAAHGPLIQIPFIVTPITIPYVNGPTSSTDTLDGPQTTPGQTTSLALNDADLCGIFSGNFTNWKQITNPDTRAFFTKNAPITVVYRSDNSGTTELLRATSPRFARHSARPPRA
jgi:phosphate transport system substrate-binding protein